MSKRSPTSLSPVKRRPSTWQPAGGAFGDDERVVGRQVEVAPCAASPTANGSDGWLSTGATMMSSTIIAQREAAAEAHPDGADARAADLVVQVAGERPQVADHRRRVVQRPAW